MFNRVYPACDCVEKHDVVDRSDPDERAQEKEKMYKELVAARLVLCLFRTSRYTANLVCNEKHPPSQPTGTGVHLNKHMQYPGAKPRKPLCGNHCYVTGRYGSVDLR